MSADPQTLASQSACYICAGTSLTEGMILALLAQIVSSGGGGTGGHILTEGGDNLSAENGNLLITET